jgi:catechol 2,3-dioxygenase-like lactoylglutathione lyase family enzyme
MPVANIRRSVSLLAARASRDCSPWMQLCCRVSTAQAWKHRRPSTPTCWSSWKREIESRRCPVVTLFITVRHVARSRDFYSRVLGGTVVLDENPCMVKLSNSWIIMNPGGPPTPDKPGISVVDYQPGDTTSIFLNLRVADIQACYQEWKAKGAEFVTPPINRGAEIRCHMRDPDGYLIEVGQSTGLLHGKLAAKRPEDLPG